jgi:hypothetical protein
MKSSKKEALVLPYKSTRIPKVLCIKVKLFLLRRSGNMDRKGISSPTGTFTPDLRGEGNDDSSGVVIENQIAAEKEALRTTGSGSSHRTKHSQKVA